MTPLDIDGEFHTIHFGSFGLIAKGKKEVNQTRLCLHVGETDVNCKPDTRQNDIYVYKSNSNSAFIEKVQKSGLYRSLWPRWRHT